MVARTRTTYESPFGPLTLVAGEAGLRALHLPERVPALDLADDDPDALRDAASSSSSTSPVSARPSTSISTFRPRRLRRRVPCVAGAALRRHHDVRRARPRARRRAGRSTRPSRTAAARSRWPTGSGHRRREIERSVDRAELVGGYGPQHGLELLWLQEADPARPTRTRTSWRLRRGRRPRRAVRCHRSAWPRRQYAEPVGTPRRGNWNPIGTLEGPREGPQNDERAADAALS